MDGLPQAQDGFDLWSLCWIVSSVFATKFEGPAKCLKCGKDISKGSGWRSEFVATAVKSQCAHKRKGHLCGVCDEDIVRLITKAEQKCFIVGCEERLEVDEVVVRKRLTQDPELLEQYFDNIKAHTVTCNICMEIAPRPKRSLTKACQHESRTCAACVSNLIKTAVDTGSFEDIRCPDAKCMEKLGATDVRFFALPESVESYETATFLRTLGQMPEFRHCLAKGCGWGQLHPPKDKYPKICCHKCGADSCFTCQIPWHRGQTCDEHKTGVSGDTMGLRKFCKRCPSAKCGVYIEKNGACPDMTCRCGVHFCWECKIMRRGGYEHLPTCRWDPGDGARPDPAQGVYRIDWDDDPDYEGTPWEYGSGYARLRRGLYR